jgi:hypothetical protein
MRASSVQPQRAARLLIEPLGVVDGDDNAPVVRKPPQEAEQPGRDRARLGGLARRLLEEERNAERATLRRGQPTDLVVDFSQEVAEAGVRQLAFGLRRARLEDTES